MTHRSATPWWIGAVGYEIYPRSFADANGDGIGDLEGIRTRLPYVADLGVDAVWLTPFYPSPGFDHGYDVSDYRGVDPAHGTLDDFDRLVTDAHGLGLRLVIDIVPNHSSSAHPWFEAARRDPDHPKRNYYVWRDPAPDGGPPNNWVSYFGGSAWTLDEKSGQYYCHLFLPEQPDLNWANPAVADEFDEILRFWCERGVDGFRVDVASGLAKDPRFRDNPRRTVVPDEADPLAVFASFEHRYDVDQNATVEIYRRWNRVVAPYDVLLLGEIGSDDPVRTARYHDGGTALHCNFYLRPAGLGWEPMILRDGIRGMHLASPDSIAWVIDNHDNSRAVTRYGGGPAGAARARCVTTLLMGLGGLPFLYQGQELDLDDGVIDPVDLADPISTRNPGAAGRDGARTAMPWDDAPGNGFTAAPRAWLRTIDRPPPETVAGQQDDPGSSLSWHRRLVATRRAHPELWARPAQWIDTTDSLLMVVRRGAVVVVANLDEYPAKLPLPAGSWRPEIWSRPELPQSPVVGGLEIPAETSVILTRET